MAIVFGAFSMATRGTSKAGITAGAKRLSGFSAGLAVQACPRHVQLSQLWVQLQYVPKMMLFEHRRDVTVTFTQPE